MKSIDEVLGFQINCPDYEPCPLCYGCRSYNPEYYKCLECSKNKKKNLCDTSKHRDGALAKMLSIQKTAV